MRLEKVLPDGRIIKASGTSPRNRDECIARAEANLDKKVKAARQEKLAQTPASSVGTWLEYWMASKTNLKPKTRSVTRQPSTSGFSQPSVPSRWTLSPWTTSKASIRRSIKDGSSRTVWATVKTVLRQAFDDAVKRGHVDRSPVLHAPGLQPKKRSEKWLPPEQATRVVDASSSSAERARWSIALFLGLRQGEALALHWADIDLEGTHPVLVVKKSLGRETG